MLLAYKNIRPTVAKKVFIAPNAAVIGDVHVGEKSSIWFGCSVRGDVHSIRIGQHTNVQDNSCIHVTRVNQPTLIGDYVTIGHSVTLHGCLVDDYAFIGMGALILDGAMVEKRGFVAAGALVTPGKVVKSGELWAGRPAKFMRTLNDKELAFLEQSAENYVVLGQEYIAEAQH